MVNASIDRNIDQNKMADEEYSEEERNFFKVAEGLIYAGATLEAYNETKIKHLQQHVYRKLAHLPPCQRKCSLWFGKDFKR